jgi:hypothetical protein
MYLLHVPKKKSVEETTKLVLKYPALPTRPFPKQAKKDPIP